MAVPIEDYGLLGDCRSAALVSRAGSVDWLCWPRFDAPACFAALLGTPANGRWLLAPADAQSAVRRRYLPGTMVLETVFDTASGRVALTDFLARGTAAPTLVRIVRGLTGTVTMRMDLSLRFDYGISVPWVSRLPDGDGLSAVAGANRVVLRATVPMHGEDRRTVAEFAVAAGQAQPFVMSWGPSHRELPASVDPLAALDETRRGWEAWSARCAPMAPWDEAVRRSLLTLKALSYEATGGIVAAPTTSLPEQPGGVRNWDYRFCWLRDATLTLLALMNAGYYDEAQAWRAWLERAASGAPEQLQILYGLHGERSLSEAALPWLPGWGGARPVRVGNAAAGQMQLDVYGELMDALHQARAGGLPAETEAWALQRALIEHLEGAWTAPDEGIWETRGAARPFTHSKMMAWLAVDRAVKSAVRFRLPGPVERWRALARRIHADVCAHGVDPVRGCFVREYGGRALDASLLQMPVVGFLPPDDPRIRATVAAIERELCVDGLVRRYQSGPDADGLPEGEGLFLACSFWLADNLVLQGRHDGGRALFERLLALRNDLGLLAEEYDPAGHRQLGNFPQAFSHVALVNSAMCLSRRVAPTEMRSNE